MDNSSKVALAGMSITLSTFVVYRIITDLENENIIKRNYCFKGALLGFGLAGLSTSLYGFCV